MTEEDSQFLREWPKAVTADLVNIYKQIRRVHMAVIFLFMSNLGLMISVFMLAKRIK